MSETRYVFNITTDFPNHKVENTRLAQEIQASSIVVALGYIETDGNFCSIWFKDQLDAADEVTLRAVVAAHSGASLDQPVQAVYLHGVPTDDDGKPQMLPNLLPSWTSLYFTGQGDDRVNGIGAGTPFTCSSDAAGDSVIEWTFTDQVYLVGGSVLFSGAVLGDIMDYVVVAPATKTGTGTTRVVKSSYGPGNVLVPNAAGLDVIDLDNVGLVPTPGTGFWDWDDPSQGYGTVTPNYAGKGNYQLFDFEVTLGRPLVNLHVLGSAKIDFLMANITPMRVIPSWLHRAVIHNSGHVGLQMAWMFVGGRGGNI